MGQYATLATEGQINPVIARLLGQLLAEQLVQDVLVPATQPYQQVVMQTLIADPNELQTVDPFAPIVAANGAKMLSSLTAKPSGHKIAAVLRSCEVRAFIELVKLHQGTLDDVLLIGLDCLGRYENREYLKLARSAGKALTEDFLRGACNGGKTAIQEVDIVSACKACEHPVAENVDLRLCVIGADPAQQIWVEAVSDKGQEVFDALGLEGSDAAPAGREEAVAALEKQRLEFQQQHLATFEEQTQDIVGLADVLAPCINCYNCRVACPVCYCRECVFVTDTFRHAGEKYVKWAHKRGQVRMPSDTLFYHLTRMVHIGTLCVGCGQCASACPNDIPLMELFRTVAGRTQARFDYLPGRDVAEDQPLAVFNAEEFDEVTGQVK